MPIALKREVEKEVKAGKYASVSEFFRDAIRSWKEEKLYQSVLQSENEFVNGKGKKLNSLADLI